MNSRLKQSILMPLLARVVPMKSVVSIKYAYGQSVMVEQKLWNVFTPSVLGQTL